MIGSKAVICRALAASLVIVGTISSFSQPSLPASFQARTIHSPADAEIFVRFGGSGPVVLLLHGYAENSDSWAPLAADLMKDHTVVVPDLRGIGRSSIPTGGYDKKNAGHGYSRRCYRAGLRSNFCCRPRHLNTPVVFPLHFDKSLTYALVEAKGNECRKRSNCPKALWIC